MKVARYRIRESNVKDLHSGSLNSYADLQLGELRLQILAAPDNTKPFNLIPLAHIEEKDTNQLVTLRKEFIPSILYSSANNRLHGFIHEIQGLLNHRGEALATRLTTPDSGSISEIRDFLMLQLINRYEALFQHLGELKFLHPESFYRLALQIVGELATFTRNDYRPESFLEYKHHDLEVSFKPIMFELREAFNFVSKPRAIQIEIKEFNHSVWVAKFKDKTLLDSAMFVLVAKAHISTEKLRHRFPNQTTIATVDRIRNLFDAQMPGIEITALNFPPREIPPHSKSVYFEINTRDEQWSLLEKSGGLAVHIGTKLPELKLELWAIRQ
jgi:type VI secretion system protein ImpJ